MKATSMLNLTAIAIVAIAFPQILSAEGKEEVLSFTVPEGWRGERIALPPDFAPDMKLEGTEVIRFAPGMFDSKSESFFSYIFVFSVAGDAVLTDETIREEILVYYRGLAKSVLKGKGKETDTSKFTFEMAESAEARHRAAGAGENRVTEYTGTLDWVEPFATAMPQKLRFEIHAWSDPKAGRSYLVVGTSPKAIDDKEPIWEELRKIRSGFVVGGKDLK